MSTPKSFREFQVLEIMTGITISRIHVQRQQR